MLWSEVRPGHYRRPIGENEKFIKAIGDRAHTAGREHWSITCKASFTVTEPLTTDDLTTKFRHAWKALRYEHPSIASTADEGTLNYLVPDTSALEKWCEETFFVYDGRTSADDLIASFKPSPYVTAHYLTESFELILHSAHWRTDGVGAFQLLNAFFEAFSALADGQAAALLWGEEIERLVPSIEEVLKLPKQATPEIEAAADRYISTIALTKGAVGLTYNGDDKTLPLGTRNARLSLSQSTAKAVYEACRARKISVLSAIHASVAAITYAGAPADSKHKHYTSTMRFGLRTYLPEPYGTPRFASALYTGGYMLKAPASLSWAENAELYNEEYRRGVTSNFLLARREYALKVQDLLRMPVPLESTMSPPSEVDISSVDDTELLVSTVYKSGDGALAIQEVSIGVETLTRQMYCFFWTFRDHIELNLVYNEAYYDSAFPVELLGKMGETLRKELQV